MAPGGIESIVHSVLSDRPVGDAMDEFCRARGLSFRDACNEVAIEIARRFDSSAMSFHVADRVMNEVQGLIVQDMVRHGDGYKLPQPAWTIYLAFDEGEWDHGEPGDPVERFTKPLVRKALAEAGK